ncbi:MAG: ferrous iron transport protein A [Lachnospiraceae bacterium]|nr:ferrous iron transport protein A [Lachnospiraceae bacterium]
MKLSEMKAGGHGTISLLGKDERFLNRITSIGLTEGTPFQVVKNDRKMPVLVYARETLLALNRNDCEKIEVSEVMG